MLHLWAIFIGVVGIGLPVAVHFLTRPRPRVLPLSTIRFVLQAVEQRRARHRLRDLIILLLRTAAVALLAVAFARPLMRPQPLVSNENRGDALRIVILDQSQSMAALANGITSFERARPIASKYLDYRPGLRANLILAAARPRPVFDKPSSNVAALREELGSVQPLAQRLNLQAALAAAGEMLAGAGAGQRRELVIISDFQRSAWASADFSPLPKETLIQLESVAPAGVAANLAVLRVAPQGRLEQNRECRIDVEIGNYSATAREASVELTLGKASYRVKGMCPAGRATTLTAPVTLAEAGWQSGQARLLDAEDALAADNVRPVAFDVRPMPTYALITRQSPRPHPSSSHYLERALTPGAGRPGQKSSVVRIDPDHLDRDALAAADLIVMDHPGKLSAGNVGLLASLLRRGRAVLYVAAEGADAVNLRLLSDAAGSDMKLPVEFVPPAATAPRSNLFLVEYQKNQAPFAVFGGQMNAALSPLRFAGGLASRRQEGGLADDVVALYSDRSACLVVTSCAAGTFAVLNADLYASSLPSSAAFVPLMGELVERMLAGRRGDDSAAPCGEPLARYLPPEAGAVEALRISGEGAGGEECGSLLADGGFIIWRCAAAPPPGVYRVQREKATAYAVATAMPASESDLATLDPVVLKDRLAGGRQVHIQSAGGDEQRKDDAWSWLLVACAMCMLCEFVSLRVFRT